MLEYKLLEMQAKNESDTNKFVKNSVHFFNPGDIILLYGDLGSGKTTITKFYAKMFGIEDRVTSPSFSIINQYHGSIIINHIDFYRVKDQKELINLGLDDILNMESINFIEWPQIIETQINWNHYRIYIEFDGNNPSGRFFKLMEYKN